tara:strand:+ start:494 stop:757 length:264 start_codon:yes stop_codon:yes gene_type:complete
MKTLERQQDARKHLLNRLEDIIEKTRAENKELLKELGKLQSAETNTFKTIVNKIEDNNFSIAQNVAQFQILRDQFVFGSEDERWWQS